MPDGHIATRATLHSAADHIRVEDQLGARNYQPLDVVLTRGQGVWVWDLDGNRYLDCLAGYSAVSQGHCHPRIREALVEQSARLCLTSRAFRTDQLAPYLQDLCAATRPGKVLPMNTGVEAVETAIKVVRKWGYEVRGVPRDQAEIVVCANNFHGRTTTVVGFSSDRETRTGFGPYAPGFRLVPFGDAAALDAAVTPQTVAVMLEPIQGEAGVIIPPPGYLRRVRDLCTRHGIVMVLDEVQTGLGRTGRMLAEEHDGVQADMTLLGKALSGGFYPVSAVLADAAILDVLRPGQHGSTFGGNPLACAVARAALRVLQEEGMIENAAATGQYLLNGLRQASSGKVREVRGSGMMLAVELHPDAGGARRHCEALRRLGLLCKDTHGHTIRVSPPLVLSRDDADWALERFARILAGPTPDTA